MIKIRRNKQNSWTATIFDVSIVAVQSDYPTIHSIHLEGGHVISISGYSFDELEEMLDLYVVDKTLFGLKP